MTSRSSDARPKRHPPRISSANSETPSADNEDYLAQYLHNIFDSSESSCDAKHSIAGSDLGKASVINKQSYQISSPSKPNLAFTLPGNGGLIKNPTSSDVLCGRGKRINNHEGNIRFREIVTKKKIEYLMAPMSRLGKTQIAEMVVAEVRKLDPPGRFLEVDKKSGLWLEIGDTRSMKKAAQALREGSQAFCQKWEPEPVQDNASVFLDRAIGSGIEHESIPFETSQNQTAEIVRSDDKEAHTINTPVKK